MPNNNRKFRWRFAALFTIAVFTVVSFLHVWAVWHTSSWEAWGEAGSFWTMVASIPRASEHFSTQFVLFDLYGPELIKAGVLVGASMTVGWWLACLLCKLAEPTDGPLGSKKQ